MVIRGAAYVGALVLALVLAAVVASEPVTAENPLRGTGDLGVVIERAAGRVKIVETSGRSVLASVDGLGDLSHASAVFSRDGRYAFVFGRDGGVSKIDLLTARIVKRVVQAGNAIGGAISQDGNLIAVSNYEPGGVRILDAETLEMLADIPAADAAGSKSKTVGLADAPDQQFVFALFDAGEIWIADLSAPQQPVVRKLTKAGTQPYDGLVTADGRYYLAGLFGEDGLALVDLWHPENGVRRVLNGYGRGEQPLPVYKMPHLEGWTHAGDRYFLPAVGRYELLVVDARSWEEVARVPVHGQPVFAVARPDARQIWVNFAHPRNDVVQVIDVDTLAVIRELRPGPAVMHLEFTPRGEQVWISSRDADRVDIYDTRTFERLSSIAADKPSGIFFTARAHRIGF